MIHMWRAYWIRSWRWTARVIIAVLAVFWLTACASPGETKQIAAYPHEPRDPIQPAPLPAGVFIVYNAYLELEVSDPDRSAARAIRLVEGHGGYMVGSRSWTVAGRKAVSLELALPATSYDLVRNTLLREGELISERAIGELIEPVYGGAPWLRYSRIHLQLWQKPPLLAAHPSLGWSPVYTFQRAFAFFGRIFAFLVDAMIWSVVVCVPFILMGWGVWALIHRLRGRA